MARLPGIDAVTITDREAFLDQISKVPALRTEWGKYLDSLGATEETRLRTAAGRKMGLQSDEVLQLIDAFVVWHIPRQGQR